MTTTEGQSGAGALPRALAIYLPQFHPIPENDVWWGKGFTEWANVTKARPQYPGHYQPHVPGELGFYDLRLPEVREAQADLAREHGIYGFIYYHYWFHGKRLLERPFNEVLASGRPDFPFALCWANGEWTANWNGEGTLLQPQKYSDQDDTAHIRWLLEAFADDRYIKIDGRPLMLIYRPLNFPDVKRTTDIWREEAVKAGFPDLYLVWVEGWGRPPGGPEAHGFDATVAFMPRAVGIHNFAVESVRTHTVIDYRATYEAVLHEPSFPWKRFPSVMVGWDNTPRRPRKATIYDGVTPGEYQRWLQRTFDKHIGVREEENYLLILAWNEWAEGNHLEPDQRYGRAFLEATRAVLLPSVRDRRTVPFRTGEPVIDHGDSPLVEEEDGSSPTLDPTIIDFDTPVANAAALVQELGIDSARGVVDLGDTTEALRNGLLHYGIDYRTAAGTAGAAGAGTVLARITDQASADRLLDGCAGTGALLALDVLEDLAEPECALSALSAWALAHDEPYLVVSVPNVAHFDLGLGLLTGRWGPTKSGLLDATHLRFFTEQALERLLASCGWAIAQRHDYQVIESDDYHSDLLDRLPEEMVGALRILSQHTNPNWAVEHFIWALTPFRIDQPPKSFGDATAPPPEQTGGDTIGEAVVAVRRYLESMGILSSEVRRRAAAAVKPRPTWQRAASKAINSSPRLASAYHAARRRIG